MNNTSIKADKLETPLRINSGVLSLMICCSIVFSYTAYGAPQNRVMPAIFDLLLSSNVVVSNVEEEINTTSAILSWTVDLPSTGQIAYGTTPELGDVTILEQTPLRAHRQHLDNLNKFTRYYYQIISTQNGAETRSSIRTFKTLPHDIDTSNAVVASSFGFNAIDATEAFRRAINSENQVVIVDRQSSDWLIEPSKFFNLADKTIIFEEGVVIRAKPNAFGASNAILFNLSKPKNLAVLGYGATLTMNKEEYTDGEGRHALTVTAGYNVTIEGLTISNSGGDGIYIADSEGVTFSKNIFIDNVVLDNHRRQAMSIISAENVTVTNSTFKNTIGTLPEAGVDLEPNQDYHRLVNINFDRCRFINNGHAGILIATLNLNQSSLPISVNVTNSYFSMNHRPGNAFRKGEVSFGSNRNSPVSGVVNFDNIEFDGSDWGIFSTRTVAEGYQVNFSNIVANDLGQAFPELSPEQGIFTMEVASYNEGESTTLGNYTFDNVLINYSTYLPVFYVFDWRTLSEIKDISGDITINNPKQVNRFVFRNNPETVLTNVDLDIQFD